MFCKLTKKPLILILSVALIGIVAVTAGLVLLLSNPSRSATVTKGKLKENAKGVVVTNGHECAEIGSSIIEQGGSAADGAIAAMFCEGIAMPQSMGLGGGFLMTLYTKETGKAETLNAREVAPLLANEDMFNGDPELSSKGGLSVAVPGELKGYWYVHQRYGKLPWSTLIQPSIDLCLKGHLVTPYLSKLFKSQEQKIFNSPTLREVYINPATNKTYEEGQYLKRKTLARTLHIIAEEGADALYNGRLTQQFVDDIQALGGIITREDLNSYKPEWSEPIVAHLPNDEILYSMPLPGSGTILAFIMNILNGFIDVCQHTCIKNYQRIVESFKYGYGKRTELGDKNFVSGIEDLITNLTSPDYAAAIRSMIQDDRTYDDPKHYGANTSLLEDHGTAHISILAPNGDAVSVTSTINLYFGAYIRSTSTGIILNDQMDDFSAPNITNSFGLPPSPANYISPGKRPLSSMTPSIIIDKDGDVRMVVGAAGGSKITTSVALVVLRYLWMGFSLQDAMDSSRLHHQLFPMSISFEKDFNQEIINSLAEIGHNYTKTIDKSGFAAVIAISRYNDVIEGFWDRRRTGSVAYL